MKSLGKKGMMDDLFDFFYTIIAGLFLLFFISLALTGGIAESQQKSIDQIAGFHQKDIALNHLAVQVEEGTNIPAEEVDSLIAESNLWKEKVITGCWDYQSSTDCLTDPAQITKGLCNWVEEEEVCFRK
ncbi:MAG TPA: hypothetical protein VJA23_00805 [Candidatus Nanoarchaeia archaeon]|nr:hypothetical protein [Candidatus Nanoarchaeia archaeon]